MHSNLTQQLSTKTFLNICDLIYERNAACTSKISNWLAATVLTLTTLPLPLSLQTSNAAHRLRVTKMAIPISATHIFGPGQPAAARVQRNLDAGADSLHSQEHEDALLFRSWVCCLRKEKVETVPAAVRVGAVGQLLGSPEYA